MSTERLARFVVQTDYRGIPEQAMSIARKAILDGLGVSLAGSREQASSIITRYVGQLGGEAEAGVIASGFRANAPLAALANGTMCHALDFDDYCYSGMGHPTAVLMPVVMALAERNNSSGKEVLAAYVLGWEIGARICATAPAKFLAKGWHPTGAVGTVACATAAAKLLKLDVHQTRMALGIAASEAGGLRLNFGSDVKPLHAGMASCHGIMAAQLAGQGFTANDCILEAPIGFLSTFVDGGELGKLSEGLGSTFDILSSAVIKPYPCGGLIHKSVDAILRLVQEHDLKPHEVAEVETHVLAFAPKILIHSRPRTGLEGKFSMEYCMAAAILDRELTLRQFTDEKVGNPEAQGLLRRVKYVIRETADQDFHTVPQAVKVKLHNGKELFCEVSHQRGDPQNPLSWEDVAGKFRDCAQAVVPAQDAERIISLMSNLESLINVSELMTLMSKAKH